MSKSNNGLGQRGYDADVGENMAAYDRLPRHLRDTLKYSDHNWSAAQCQVVLRMPADKRPARAKTPRLLAAAIIENDMKRHAADAAEGKVCP